MNDRKTILIFYAKGRNDSSALLLENYINENFRDFYALAIPDTSYFVSPFVKMSESMHKNAMANFNWAAKAYYSIEKWFIDRRFEKAKDQELDKSETVDKQTDLKNNDRDVNYEKMKNILYRYRPEVVICMTPYSHRLVLKYKKKMNLDDLHIYSMILDYSLDKRFINEEIQGYFVQNEEIKEEIIINRIPAESIEVVGTPVDAKVLAKKDRAETLKKYDIPDDGRKIIFISSGRIAQDQLKVVMAYLLKSSLDAIFLVNARNSKTLIAFLKTIIGNKTEDRVYAISEVDDIADIYSIIDFAIVAPTALTTYELIMRHKPMVLLKGITPSEIQNANYLLTKQMAVSGFTKDELLGYTQKMLDDEEFRYQFVERSLNFTHKKAVEVIAKHVYAKADEIYAKRHPNEDKRVLNKKEIKVKEEVNNDVKENSIDNKNKENKKNTSRILIKKRRRK